MLKRNIELWDNTCCKSLADFRILSTVVVVIFVIGGGVVVVVSFLLLLLR